MATALIQIFADHVRAWFNGATLAGLRTAVTEYLRDEIFDIQRTTRDEIRPSDE